MKAFKPIGPKPVQRYWCEVRVTYTTTDPVKRPNEAGDALVDELVESDPKTEVISVRLREGEDATFESKGELRRRYKHFHLLTCEVIGPSSVKHSFVRNHTSSSLFNLSRV